MKNSNFIHAALEWCLVKYLRMQIRLDRNVLKRYFGIETPLYRIWHSENVKKMQRKLDREHKALSHETI